VVLPRGEDHVGVGALILQALDQGDGAGRIRLAVDLADDDDDIDALLGAEALDLARERRRCEHGEGHVVLAHAPRQALGGGREDAEAEAAALKDDAAPQERARSGAAVDVGEDRGPARRAVRVEVRPQPRGPRRELVGAGGQHLDAGVTDEPRGVGAALLAAEEEAGQVAGPEEARAPDDQRLGGGGGRARPGARDGAGQRRQTWADREGRTATATRGEVPAEVGGEDQIDVGGDGPRGEEAEREGEEPERGHGET